MALWVNGEILFVKVYASPFCSECYIAEGGNRSKALQRSQRGRQFCEVDSGEFSFSFLRDSPRVGLLKFLE